MANYLRPKRGLKNTAINKNIILKRGEVFFEMPDSGIGTGIGKIKMGDGRTAYSQLPYFLEQKEIDVSNTSISFTENTSTNNNALLNTINTGAKLNTIIGAIKKLLNNINTELQNKATVLIDNKTELGLAMNVPASKYSYFNANIEKNNYIPIAIIDVNFLNSGEGTVSLEIKKEFESNKVTFNFTNSSDKNAKIESLYYTVVYIKK